MIIKLEYLPSSILSVCILTCVMASEVLHADCDPSVAKNFPTTTAPNFYGNGQTDSFRCAINGSTDLSSLEQRDRNDLLPVKLSNRFYIMLGGNAASEGITSVKNDSIYDPSISEATLTSTETKTASNNIELAFGYSWTDFAIDLEWLAVKSVSYNASLTGVTPNHPYSTSVKGDATLFNLYWIFDDRYNFKLYAQMCLGMSSNKSTTTLDSGTATVTSRLSPAYGIGVGVRFNVVSKLFADMAGRYILLGKVKYQAANGTGNFMILKATRTWLGISARLIWMI
jgi:opacity protein-like surface antigen